MGGDVASSLALLQADGQTRQAHRPYKEAQRVPWKQVGNAEGQRYSQRQQQESRNDELSDVEAKLRDGSVDISPAEHPPRSAILVCSHETLLLSSLRGRLAALNQATAVNTRVGRSFPWPRVYSVQAGFAMCPRKIQGGAASGPLDALDLRTRVM